MGLVGLFCRLLFICLLLCFLEALLEASILHQGQALGADTAFAWPWFLIFEGFIGLLKGLVGLLDLLKLLLLFLELSFQVFITCEFLAAGRNERAMRMGFAITLICSWLGLFLVMIYDFDCVRLITFIVHLDT